MNKQMVLKRAEILLKATYDILQKQQKSPYVLDILCETAIWDEVECDGYCLQDDIAEWLQEFGEKEYEI